MSESVNLPALGESVTEGTVTRWLKNVGDRVEVDEPLLEVSTDKVDTEIPSPVAGVVEEILVAEDETVEVGTALVRIGDGASDGADDATPAPEVSDTGASEAEASDAGASDTAAEADAADAGSAGTHDDSPEQTEAEQTEAQHTSAEQPAPAAPAEPAPQVAPNDASETGDEPAEVPSTDAPAPDESRAAASSDSVEAPAPAADVDPAPAASPEAQHAAQQDDGPVVAAPAVASATASDTVAAPVETSPVETSSVETSSAEPETEPAPTDTASAQAETTTASHSNAGYVTPLVRKLAGDHGVDLSTVTGTGVGGRIRKEDVLGRAEQTKADEAKAEAAKTAEGEKAAAATEAAAVSAAPAAPGGVKTGTPVLETSPLRGTTVPMSRLRKVVAERAVASMQASAQLTSVVEVDVTKIAAYRDAVKADFAEKAGVKLSFLPFFALAASRALKAFPVVNATVDGDTIVYPGHENLSIAVDTERGLLTPVIRDASDLTLAQLAQQIADLAARTRDNKLKPDELAGGTFTLTNTGSRGALFDTPVVFLPQSAILGTGIVTKKPMVVSQGGVDAIAIRSTVYLALSYDHRIVDGADAARFLVAVKSHLESGEFAADLGI
ncbi:MAG: hypothetical protein RI885_1777 [Actinomycetota bacterium]